MRSSATKLTLGLVAWIAFGAAAVFIAHSERQLADRRSALRAFDVVAREAAASLAGVKAAQQGYVAPGQGPGFWMARVDTLLEQLTARVDELRPVAAGSETAKTLVEVGETLGDLRAIDKRARQYLSTDQALMASDVIFSEGGETAAIAGRQVEAARQAEYGAFDAAESTVRRQQVYAASAAVGLAALIVAALVLVPAPVAAQAAAPRERARAGVEAATGPQLAEPAVPAVDIVPDEARPARPARSGRPAEGPVSTDLPRETVPVLTATAELCSEFTRVHDLGELTRLLGRAAQVLDASGIVVWVGAPGAAMLRPVLAHGYSSHALARMPHVPRTGDNAAAAAFRTGKLQIVLTRPGHSVGALAAPMMTPNGCIGALTAEIKNGGEMSDGVQALSSILASQLAGILAESVLQAEDAEDEAPASRIASA